GPDHLPGGRMVHVLNFIFETGSEIMRLIRRAWPLLLPLIAVVAWAATEMMSVQVRSGQLRDKPSFLGKVQTTVAYGDRLSVLETQGAWTKVQGDGGSGWIHTSALSPKKFVLKAGDTDAATGASGEELALAGKGFNDEVESEYRAGNPQADYTWVNRMEKISITPDQAAEFLKAGGVNTSGGGK
nr:SH3 domain-containing protein [Candidatus Krumholzibacteria bacterium]